jgi:hypothetical protein
LYVVVTTVIAHGFDPLPSLKARLADCLRQWFIATLALVAERLEFGVGAG